MAIKVLYTAMGMIIGDVTENETLKSNTPQTLNVENPCVIQFTQKGVMLAPLLDFVEENSLTINLSELTFQDVFEPIVAVRNEYTTMYGGIQLQVN